MAKQKGILPLVGSIGGINFYYLNGKPVARIAGGGFTRDGIRTKASMQRVRENGSEFGHCSRVNKVFRHAILPVHNFHKFTFFHSRLMTLFTGLKDLDSVNKRGERRVAISLESVVGKNLLKDFTYTPECIPLNVFPIAHSLDWNTGTLHFPEISTEHVLFVKGATHLSLQFGLLDFNFESLEYDLQLAEPLILPKNFLGTNITLGPEYLPTNQGLQIAVLGIRYYQEVEGQLYVLNGKDGVGIGVLGVRD